jgi:HD superfamily phosphohydrolase
LNQKPKLYRDPVHDIIAFHRDNFTDRVLCQLIETPEMQRLRRIRQLGFSNLVYHGAEHSRFVHCMGVANLARRIYDRLWPVSDPLDRLSVIAAGLCHDLGHGPFSHVMERISNIHHEDVTIAIITNPESAVFEVLSAVDSALPSRIADFYRKSDQRNPAHQIVSSQLDADRFDYILRDGLYTGVKIGVFDLERIITMLELCDEEMCVSFRATEAVEGYLLARFHMYKQVYLHKTSRAAERMLEAVVRRARALRVAKHSFAWFPTGALARLIDGELTGPLDIVQLDDVDVHFALKHWTREEDVILSELARGLVNRSLFKTLPLGNGPESEELLERARLTAIKMGLSPEYHVLIDSSMDTPYKPYVPGSGRPDESIRIAMANGEIKNIEDVSEIVQLLGQLQYHVRRLVIPAALQQALLSQ